MNQERAGWQNNSSLRFLSSGNHLAPFVGVWKGRMVVDKRVVYIRFWCYVQYQIPPTRMLNFQCNRTKLVYIAVKACLN